MIPSRGLRWSSQTIGLGRRRIDAFSVRQFSSHVQNGSFKTNPLLSKNGASIASIYTRYQYPKTNFLIRNGAGLRFASTNSLSNSAAAASIPSTTNPPEALSSSAGSLSTFTSSFDDSTTDFTSESLYNIPEHIGYLKSLGLDYGWGPTSMMEWTLEHVHILAGTPWWVSITLTAILVRAILFKPYMDAAENGSKLAAIKHITQPVTDGMKQAQTNRDTESVMRLKNELSRIHSRAGIKIWKSFVPMLQVFAGYGTFVLLRAMARLPVPGLETGGALWFYNLTLPDPYMIFPIATAGVLHWVLRKGGETGVSQVSPQVMKLMMYGLPALTVVFTWWLPAALQLSFFVSGLLAFFQASLFRMPWFRSYFNMTPLPAAPVAPVPGQKAASPYKGTMNVRAKQVIDAKGVVVPTQPEEAPLKAKKVLDGAMKDIMSGYEGARKTVLDVTARGKKGADARREKSEKEVAERYEKKRQEEIREEKRARDNERRAEKRERRRNQQ